MTDFKALMKRENRERGNLESLYPKLLVLFANYACFYCLNPVKMK